jgi:glycosyltransferase involved in cell wall biosynthesis
MFPEMLEFFRVYASRKPDARFLIVTQDPPDPIRSEARDHGVNLDRLIIRSASREDVPGFVAAADLGVAFKRPSFSAKACSPTKMGEMLAVGLPIVANSGVGDVEQMVNDIACGVAIHDFTAQGYDQAITQIETLGGTPEERRERALPWFDVKLGIERYDRIYCALTA